MRKDVVYHKILIRAAQCRRPFTVQEMLRREKIGDRAVGENKVRGASRLTRLINLNEFPINLVVKILLKDRTTGENIICATDTYAHLGNTYHPSATIRYKDVVQLNTNVIQPRVYKALEERRPRNHYILNNKWEDS